jgi:hypothetical protein
MWVSSIIILLGAELNSEIERQTAQNAAEKGTFATNLSPKPPRT